MSHSMFAFVCSQDCIPLTSLFFGLCLWNPNQVTISMQMSGGDNPQEHATVGNGCKMYEKGRRFNNITEENGQLKKVGGGTHCKRGEKSR